MSPEDVLDASERRNIFCPTGNWATICWMSDLYPCIVFIGMFQVPADQKETDLVGRSTVHKSAYKQATGKYHVCHKKKN